MTSQRTRGPWWPVAVWEFREVQRKLQEIAAMPRGQRKAIRTALANQYGMSERTLLRWALYDVKEVRCGKYEALFVIGQNRPSQVTPWEKAA